MVGILSEAWHKAISLFLRAFALAIKRFKSISAKLELMDEGAIASDNVLIHDSVFTIDGVGRVIAIA